MTTCSGKAFQESITLRLKLFDLIFSLCCFLASLSLCPLVSVSWKNEQLVFVDFVCVVHYFINFY